LSVGSERIKWIIFAELGLVVGTYTKFTMNELGTVTQAYNSSYLGGWDQKDHVSRPAQGNSSQDPFQITRWTGGVAQVVEYPLCKHEVMSSNSSLIKKNCYE
jgi:hypothetical protein